MYIIIAQLTYFVQLRFFCDCGAGSTGIHCQLLKKDGTVEQLSPETHTSRVSSNQTESNVRARCSDLARANWQNFDSAGKVVSTKQGS